VIIYKTYYHYYSSLGPEELPLSYTAGELRRDLSPIQEESPPPIDISFRLEETSLNYTTGELSGESSLVKQIELPNNSCSRKQAFRRLSLIPEESLFSVNFLNKPTLQKKK
jgi:hypothetical protein